MGNYDKEINEGYKTIENTNAPNIDNTITINDDKLLENNNLNNLSDKEIFNRYLTINNNNNASTSTTISNNINLSITENNLMNSKKGKEPMEIDKSEPIEFEHEINSNNTSLDYNIYQNNINTPTSEPGYSSSHSE